MQIGDCFFGAMIVVHCGLPNCDVALDDRAVGSADQKGELELPVSSGSHKLTVGKKGYQNNATGVRVSCGETKPINLKPAARLARLHVRTNPPGCEIQVNYLPKGNSDAQGVLAFQLAADQILINAAKSGYLSATQIVDLTSGQRETEIKLTLKPIPAKVTVNLTDQVEKAWLLVDDEAERHNASEPIDLKPGKHKITLEALGYSPVAFEVEAKAGESVSKNITLKLLSSEGLKGQAEEFLKRVRYDEVEVLSKYLSETDANPTAQRLVGFVNLARQNYAKATESFSLALAADEKIARRATARGRTIRSQQTAQRMRRAVDLKKK